MRLTTLEIVPSQEFQKALFDLQMSKGYFAFPTYSIQGQQVDIQSANLSQPIDAAGSRVEYTDITFVNEGAKPLVLPGAATVAGNRNTLNNGHEIVSVDTNDCAADLKIGGNKHNHYLPKINKLSIEIGGQEYPGTSTFDNLGSNPQRGYKIYKNLFTEDERKIKFRDWILRYFKMRFDYRGQEGLFDKAAQVIDAGGVDTNISTIRLKLELDNTGVVFTNTDLKCFLFHHVPASLLFYPKGQLVK